MKIVTALLVVLALSACGPSEEEVYDEGYNDGAHNVCMDIRDWNRNVYRAIRSERIC